MSLEIIQTQLYEVINELLTKITIKEHDLFVLGCSTSEILGKHIGTHSSREVGEMVIATIKPLLDEKGIFLAVQGCEHINRALTLERQALEFYGYEEVMVVPALHAGGATSVVAYGAFTQPVVTEHIQARAGIDIGDTAIGMHVRHVQIPVRLSYQEIGDAHLTALTSRPKYIGGPRATYK